MMYFSILDWIYSINMSEDIADKVDDFICAWDKVVDKMLSCWHWKIAICDWSKATNTVF